MIVFIQPFGLQSAAGGPRILRSLLQDAPGPFVSVCSAPQAPPAVPWAREVHVPVRPCFGRIEATRYGGKLGHLCPLFARTFRRRLTRLCRETPATAIHAIPQGLDFWYAFRVAQTLELPYFLNVHDDLAYGLQGRPELRAGMAALREVWRQAQGRLVISEEMGQEYCRRYGDHPYCTVTDGVEIPAARPLEARPESLRVYFMGSLHLSYRPNFEALYEALGALRRRRPDLTVTVTCRGSAIPSQVPGVTVTVLPWMTETEVARDMERADVLYLPLPFAREHELLCRFSLSTKMVSYLGSGRPILYHGPAYAAAAQLLRRHGAGVAAESLDPVQIATALEAVAAQREALITNALALAQSQFCAADQRAKFWRVLLPGSLPPQESDTDGHSVRVREGRWQAEAS
jgi:glycosyltransferase involved in cell wall biosynthesis